MSKYTLFALALTIILGGAGFAGNALAAEPEKTDSTGFVCPIISTDGVLHADTEHSGNLVADLGDGEYTIGPTGSHDLSVPLLATNGGGAGTPGGDHSAPGDTDYTAIWSGQ